MRVAAHAKISKAGYAGRRPQRRHARSHASAATATTETTRVTAATVTCPVLEPVTFKGLCARRESVKIRGGYLAYQL